MSKKRIIVSVSNDLATDQRVRKVCEALHEFEYDVLLVGRRLSSSLLMPTTDYRVKRMRLIFTKGPLFYAFYNLRLFLLLLFSKTDVLLANDLDTLYANSWAKKFKKNCVLIYDSHEYFTGVPELVNRPKIQQFWKKIEQRSIPVVDKMYTVNQSIANLYEKEYNIRLRVVRNISDYKKVANAKSRDELGLPNDKFIVIMQGAGINIDRGAEEMVEAIKRMDNILFLLVGSGDAIPSLKTIVNNEGLQNTVRFIDKLPYNEMMNFTRAADLGVSLDKDSNINYKFSLPNKLFDYIHAGIPLLVTNLVELKRIVEDYQVGVVIDDLKPNTIVSAIESIKSDPTKYQTFKNNTEKAKKELNWENEKKVLKEIYD